LNTLTKRFIKDSNLVTRCITGETIIVPIKAKVGDLDSIYTLNEVGTRIWQLIDGRTDTHQIIEAISREYEVTGEEATKDVIDFLERLEVASLIDVTSHD
jgi:coenzyme PQQ synthesis protein D (PqqD)